MTNYCGHGNPIGNPAGVYCLCGDCEDGGPAPEPMDLEDDDTEAHELYVIMMSVGRGVDVYEVLGSVDDEPGVWIRNTRSCVESLVLRENMHLMVATCRHGYVQLDSCPSCDLDAEHHHEVAEMCGISEAELGPLVAAAVLLPMNVERQLGRATELIRQLLEELDWHKNGVTSILTKRAASFLIEMAE